MNWLILAVSYVMLCSALFGCTGAPGEVKRFEIPASSVTYIEEIYFNGGAAVADNTKVYVTGKGAGAERRLVLSGSNLEIKTITPIDATKNIICFSGITDTYVNETVVQVNGRSVKVISRLNEDC
ncbi:hypothetical protein [Pelomonas cellulosilytica]|uniref:IPT/TIG domain-containing protein n=1 Tax=Pelomonas cellulosilytica TaxID=2906762 RepID=A0ABS8Y3Y4_9BURK|nr:hypothetical protein [Pelomonas sp. P8]MCE4556770.1 hypothetical protein [Pelomonas sp. P8]